MIKKTKLERVLRNVRPKDRKIIREEIAKIKKRHKPKKSKTAGSISKASSFKKWSKDIGQLRSTPIPSKKIKKKKTKQKEKYLVDLKREKEMAEKGWKVARTRTYLELPKKAIGKNGYPYAVLNKNKNYESFYTWKEKPSKKKVDNI